MYKLIVAKIYSSADNVFIIICVSTIINKQNRKAPPSDSSSSNIGDWKTICNNPPTIRIKRPAKRLETNKQSAS